jgi:hypothetical protein
MKCLECSITKLLEKRIEDKERIITGLEKIIQDKNEIIRYFLN